MAVESYVPRVLPEVKALRYEQGITTKRQILEFCPTASVGVPQSPDNRDDMDNTDVRWLVVSTPDNPARGVNDGDYIVYFQITGYYRVFDHVEFDALYERKRR